MLAGGVDNPTDTICTLLETLETKIDARCRRAETGPRYEIGRFL